MKVLDFGASKKQGEPDVASSAFAMAAPHFWSPAQVRNWNDVDARTDVWAIGVLHYKMVTGRLPFEGDAALVLRSIPSAPITSPTALLGASLPTGFEDVVLKALARDPAHRFATAAGLEAR